MGIEHARPGGLPVTASFGVSAARGQAVEFDPLFREADASLYLAKRNGRNQVIGRERRPAGASRVGIAAASLGVPGPVA
jgi:PleD family two-component response regulator